MQVDSFIVILCIRECLRPSLRVLLGELKKRGTGYLFTFRSRLETGLASSQSGQVSVLT